MALLRHTLAAVLLCASLAPAAQIGVGDPAPDFSVSDWHGKPSTLAARRGRVVVVDFWATWCATCKTALPALDALARRHPSVEVLAVSIDGSRDTADRYLAERLPKPAMTLLHDPGGSLLARFGAGGMPALYVIDGDGVVRVAESGYAPDRLTEVERTLERMETDGRGKAP